MSVECNHKHSLAVMKLMLGGCRTAVHESTESSLAWEMKLTEEFEEVAINEGGLSWTTKLFRSCAVTESGPSWPWTSTKKFVYRILVVAVVRWILTFPELPWSSLRVLNLIENCYRLVVKDNRAWLQPELAVARRRCQAQARHLLMPLGRQVW